MVVGKRKTAVRDDRAPSGAEENGFCRISEQNDDGFHKKIMFFKPYEAVLSCLVLGC